MMQMSKTLAVGQDEIDEMTDEEIAQLQQALNSESSVRQRVAWFPEQLRTVIIDTRTEGIIPDEAIREIFEDAMNADID